MSRVLPAEGDLRRVIGDGAAVPDGEVDGLSHDDLLTLYRNLVLLRTYDERSVIYHRQGRIGTYAIFWNHEAMQAGSVFALEDRDWIFPSYRESAIGLLRGIPAATILSWWRGHPTGWWSPVEHNVASICVPIGTHVPHAVGYAWGARLKGEDRVAITYFGDGATSKGDVHEGTTFAGIQHAAGDPRLQQQPLRDHAPLMQSRRPCRRVADAAIGYGIPSVSVDGPTYWPCTRRLRDAASRVLGQVTARRFIEAIVVPATPHSPDDDDRSTSARERSEAARRQDPSAWGASSDYLRRIGAALRGRWRQSRPKPVRPSSTPEWRRRGCADARSGSRVRPRLARPPRRRSARPISPSSAAAR